MACPHTHQRYDQHHYMFIFHSLWDEKKTVGMEFNRFIHSDCSLLNRDEQKMAEEPISRVKPCIFFSIFFSIVKSVFVHVRTIIVLQKTDNSLLFAFYTPRQLVISFHIDRSHLLSLLARNIIVDQRFFLSLYFIHSFILIVAVQLGAFQTKRHSIQHKFTGKKIHTHNDEKLK